MRIVVVGAGAMGGLFGARLAAAGHDVLLYDIWREHVEAIQAHGLVIEELDGSVVRYRVPATDRQPSALRDADLVLVQVKAYDTYGALAPLAALIPATAYVLSVQNGLGNLEQMRRALPAHERLLLGTSAHGSMVLGPGRLRHTGRGLNVVGVADPASAASCDLSALRETLTGAGIETDLAENIHLAIWKKLAANVAINAICALSGVRNGTLHDDADLSSLSQAAVLEMVAVMTATGLDPGAEDYLAYSRLVMKWTAPTEPSMLQDIRRGRRTEIDAINGAVAKLGDELGVPAPVNRWLAALVRHREADARRVQGD
jgi:2-dehydropantoate 2-reductase